MGVTLKSSILDWDFPLQTIQLLGYPHGHGDPHIILNHYLSSLIIITIHSTFNLHRFPTLRTNLHENHHSPTWKASMPIPPGRWNLPLLLTMIIPICPVRNGSLSTAHALTRSRAHATRIACKSNLRCTEIVEVRVNVLWWRKGLHGLPNWFGMVISLSIYLSINLFIYFIYLLISTCMYYVYDKCVYIYIYTHYIWI